MNEIEAIEPDLAKELAKYELGSIAEMRKILLDEHSSSYRWLVAPLLAVNGGSALGLFGSTVVSIELKLGAGLAFFIGTFLSLLCAFFGQGAVKKVTIPLTTLAGFWVAVSHNGDFNPTIYKRLQDDLRVASKAGMPTRISGWLAAMAFSTGVLWTGYSLAHRLPAIGSSVVSARPHIQAPLAVRSGQALTKK